MITDIVIALAILAIIAFAGVRVVGLTPYAVLSGSMEPMYPTGSLIYVSETDPSDVVVGDAITFELESGTLVTHQVYEIDAEAQQFRTQGIANIGSDGAIVHDARPVPFDRLVGTPRACIPLLGYLNSFLTSTAGMFALGACVLALIALNVAAALFSRDDRPKGTRRANAPGRHAASRGRAGK